MDCELPAVSNTTSNNLAPGHEVATSKGLRPRRLHARRHSSPGSSSGGVAASGCDGSSSAMEPAIGHSAGQLPPLPNMPGIVWGLPTNPLQICPKTAPPALPPPMAAMMGSMGMGMPMGMPPVPPMPGPWGMAMPPMLPAMGMPMAPPTSLFSPSQAPATMPGMPIGMPMPMAPSATPPMPMAMPGVPQAMPPAGAGLAFSLCPAQSSASSLMPTAAASSFNLTQAGSMPLPPAMPSASLPSAPADPTPRISCGGFNVALMAANGSSVGVVGGGGGMLPFVMKDDDDDADCLAPPAKRAESAPAGLLHDFDALLMPSMAGTDISSLSGSELLLEACMGLAMDVEPELPPVPVPAGKAAAPIGLQLKKSPSLVDFISASLIDVATCPA